MQQLPLHIQKCPSMHQQHIGRTGSTKASPTIYVSRGPLLGGILDIVKFAILSELIGPESCYGLFD